MFKTKTWRLENRMSEIRSEALVRVARARRNGTGTHSNMAAGQVRPPRAPPPRRGILVAPAADPSALRSAGTPALAPHLVSFATYNKTEMLNLFPTLFKFTNKIFHTHKSTKINNFTLIIFFLISTDYA